MTGPVTPSMSAAAASSASPYTAYSVSWNLTQRCNLECAHCYMSAHAGADTRGELSTAECRRVMDEIAAVNPNVFLILTGGEPLLRRGGLGVRGSPGAQEVHTAFGRQGPQLLLPRTHGARARSHRHRRRGLRGDPDVPREGPGRGAGAAVVRAADARHGRRGAGREIRGPLVDAGRPRRRSAHPREVRAALPSDLVAAESLVRPVEELRPRLVPRRQVLLPHHARGRRHAVPLHAAERGQPPQRGLRRALALVAGLRRPARSEARRTLRRLRVLEDLRRLPLQDRKSVV